MVGTVPIKSNEWSNDECSFYIFLPISLFFHAPDNSEKRAPARAIKFFTASVFSFTSSYISAHVRYSVYMSYKGLDAHSMMV